jgi:predicted ATPase/DNA-binding CsgD family transcriptional regulator
VSSRRLVGRRDELARFHAAFEACLENVPSTVVVAGEAGVGKTRLVREFLRYASERGATTATGSCFELAETSLPYAPFVAVLRRLVQKLERDRRDAVLASARPGLVHLLPELATPGDPGADRVSGSSQARLFELLLGVLQRLSDDGPVVVAIEDLQWADRSTLDLLGFLIRSLAAGQVLGVCTYRSDELHRGHPLAAFLAELDRRRTIERIELRRFTPDEVAEQLEEISGEKPDRALVSSVFERSQGNAFFAEELFAASQAGDPRQLPPTLRAILLARVDRLGPAGQEVLRVAAAAGRPVSEALLAAVSPLPSDLRLAGLREAVAQQVLVAEAGESYAFRHELQREAVYDELLPGERTELHAAYALALSESASAVGEVAYHWRAAHDLPRALVASVAAGRAAEAGYGFAEAQAFYELALELWQQVPDAAERAGLDEVTLRRRAAEAANLAGDHGRAAALMRSAIARAEAESPELAGLLNERLGRFLWASGDSSAALSAYETALRLVPVEPPSPARARALAARGQAFMLLARYEESRPSCEEAIAIARAVGARAEEGHALNTLGFDLSCLGDPEAGVEHLRLALEIAGEVGDLDDLARAYLNLSELLGGPLNRLEEALRLALEGVELSRRVGLARDYGVSLQASAVAALYELGRWDDALAILAEAEQTSPIEMAAIDLHHARAKLLVSRGEYGDAGRHLHTVSQLMVNTVDPQYNVPFAAREAELALWQGNHAEARRAVEAGLEALAGTDDDWFVGPLLWLGAWAEADALLEERLLRRAETADPGRFAALASDVIGRGTDVGRFVPPSTVAYAALCEAEGTRAQAPSPAAWRDAAEEWERVGHPYPCAYARWREAEALLGARRSREAENALRAAHTVASELGAKPLLGEVAALAARAKIDLGAEAELAEPPAPTPADEVGLTPRERQVLDLICRGLTNREIASTLFVTEKTAGAHVSNILAKLEVRSRVEAATVAHRLRLVATTAEK